MDNVLKVLITLLKVREVICMHEIRLVFQTKGKRTYVVN